MAGFHLGFSSRRGRQTRSSDTYEKARGRRGRQKMIQREQRFTKMRDYARTRREAEDGVDIVHGARSP